MSELMITRIYELYALGLDPAEIAAFLGVSPQLVSRALQYAESKAA